MQMLFRAVLVAAALHLLGFSMPSRAEGWISLIDGEKGLESFDRIGDANWRAEDGAIVADRGAGGQLVTKQAYRDVEIDAEFWADHTTNSGIFVRVRDPGQISFADSYEVNIFDQRPGQEYGTGAIVGFASVHPPYPRAGGRWNRFRIQVKGPELVVELNGQVTVRLQDDTFKEGPISLQYGPGADGRPGGAIKWRTLRVLPGP